VTTAWSPMPDQLWRASFTVPGSMPPEAVGALEERALSVSLFAIEDEASTEPVAWRIDLFFGEEPDPAVLRAELAAALPGPPTELEVTSVPAQDWLAASAMQQEPVQVGRFFIHGPKDRDRLPAGALPIEVEAGLAFGSGEHATTQACLEAIDRLARVHRFRRVLDLGCGSGILAMGAARCWPARLVAADYDPVAVRVARENIALNGLAGRITTVVSDGMRHSLIRRRAPYDLVLANILADPLIELAPAITRRVAPGGFVVLSGLLDRQALSVEQAYAAAGLRLAATIARTPWMGLVFRRPRRGGWAGTR
jgi:ribosomal protein L11 methyltransferase